MQTFKNLTIRKIGTAIASGVLVFAAATMAKAENWQLLVTETYAGQQINMYADLDGVVGDSGWLFFPAIIDAGNLRVVADLVYDCDSGLLSDVAIHKTMNAITGEDAPLGSYAKQFKRDMLSEARKQATQDDIDGTKLSCVMFGA